MNKTLAGIELLYKKGELSQEEYESTVNKYKTFKYAIIHLEESVQMRIEALMDEERQEVKERIYKRMSMMDRQSIKEYQAKQDRKNKILDLYANGQIDEDTAKKMLSKEEK